MKLIACARTLVLALSLLLVASCEKQSPIMLGYPQEDIEFDNELRTLKLAVWMSTTELVMKGGDGKFSVSNSSDQVADVSSSNDRLRITPKTEGETLVSITDGKGQKYDLFVGIGHIEETYTVREFYDLITGKEITLKQREELTARIAADSYVGVNGGYRLVHENAEQTYGESFSYADMKKADCRQTGFYFEKDRTVFIDNLPVMNGEKLPAFARITLMETDDYRPSVLYMTPDLGPAPAAKSSPAIHNYSLVEDVTKLYGADFPGAGTILTVRRVVRNSEWVRK